MTIQTHDVNGLSFAEILSETAVIETSEQGLDLVGNLYYDGHERVIFQQRHFAPAFFDLKTGLAGEVLQKFTNYRIRLAIVGDFAAYPGQSLQDFIRESNKGRQVYFAEHREQAVRWLVGKPLPGCCGGSKRISI